MNPQASALPAYVGPGGRFGFVNQGLVEEMNPNVYDRLIAQGASHEVAEEAARKALRREVIAHEMLHRTCASVEMRTQPFYMQLNEAITQHLTTQIKEIGADALGYPQLKVFSDALVDVAGEDALRKAYFKGELSELRRIVDRKGGAGTFKSALELLNQGKSSAAAKMLKTGKLRSRIGGRKPTVMSGSSGN